MNNFTDHTDHTFAQFLNQGIGTEIYKTAAICWIDSLNYIWQDIMWYKYIEIFTNSMNWIATLPGVVVWVVNDEVIGGWIVIAVLKQKLFNSSTNMWVAIQILIHDLKAYVWQAYNNMTYPKCFSVTLKAYNVTRWKSCTDSFGDKIT